MSEFYRSLWFTQGNSGAHARRKLPTSRIHTVGGLFDRDPDLVRARVFYQNLNRQGRGVVVAGGDRNRPPNLDQWVDVMIRAYDGFSIDEDLQV